MPTTDENRLGLYLKDRRARLDPVACGFTATRRRTPGLRREEVAQRANVSATWYTWLEQGRGGSPSADVLDRLSRALSLSPAEREHLFLLAQNRHPIIDCDSVPEITPQLRRVLDSLQYSPAIVKTATWDIIAWNRAAAAVLVDYAEIAPEERNLLRMLFTTPRARARMADWEMHARFTVAAFRSDIARIGMTERVEALIDELRDTSEAFDTIWREHDVRPFGQGMKQLHHAVVGPLALEYSAFSVDGHPELGVLIFTAVTAEDEAKIRTLVQGAGLPMRDAAPAGLDPAVQVAGQ